MGAVASIQPLAILQHTISLNALSAATVGVAYSAPLGVVYHGSIVTTGVTWQLASAGNLPPGAAVSTSGVLTATFASAATYSFTVTLTIPTVLGNMSSYTGGTFTKTITVNAVESNGGAGRIINVALATPPSAQLNVAYATSLGSASVTGTNPPTPTWSVANAGNLPSGYSLSSSGLLSATFTSAGAVTFVVKVSATGAAPVEKGITINAVSSGGSAGNPTAPSAPPVTEPPPPPAVFATVAESGTDLVLVTHLLTDDGLGNLNPTQDHTGTVNYDTGELYFPPEIAFSTRQWSSYSTNGSGEWTDSSITDAFANGAQITVSYRPDSVVPTDASETLPAQNIILDLAPYTADYILPGSVEFQIGSTVYQDVEGEIWHTVNPNTGAGTPAGTIDYGNGRVTLTNWVTGSSAFILLSLATFRGQHTDTEMTFRTSGSPLRPSGLQLACTAVDGELLTGTTNIEAELVGDDLEGTVDLTFGLIDVRFGETVLDSSLTEAEKLEEWYDADDVDEDGYIWKPRTVTPSTVRYNAVMYAYLPLSADLIGLDPVRLPSDGRVPIFRPGQLALIHHTDAFTESSLSPTQALDCGRLRLYRVVIEDVDQQRLPASFFVVNRELGIVTMASDLNLTGYTAPYKIYHTVADLSLVTNSEITGELTFNKACSHAYPIDDTYPSYVSNVLYAGTLQARYSNLFAQSAWTSVWSDTLIGSAPLAQYNDTLYPLTVSNLGAYTDRMLIKFTSSTAFQVIGENLGLIATGNINEDCAPVNSLTGQPYFTIDYRGWGTGWSTGNCVRFNLIGSNYPVDLIRAVQPSNPTGADDSVELLFVGNVDA